MKTGLLFIPAKRPSAWGVGGACLEEAQRKWRLSFQF